MNVSGLVMGELDFDLLAVRTCITYHLWELAKVSSMARNLVDSKISMDESWFKAGGVGLDQHSEGVAVSSGPLCTAAGCAAHFSALEQVGR